MKTLEDEVLLILIKYEIVLVNHSGMKDIGRNVKRIRKVGANQIIAAVRKHDLKTPLKKHPEICACCGITVKEGYKSMGVIQSTCVDCKDKEEERFYKRVQEFEDDPGWYDVGRSDI